MLNLSYTTGIIEAGCDEAGRGSLAGPVYASAVILPDDFSNKDLNDSKKLNAKQRDRLRYEIEKEAICWAVDYCVPSEIDEINILNASIKAMHKALSRLDPQPELILVDGNRFTNYKKKKHLCIIKGDAIFSSIAAASILAKTHRDEYMDALHDQYPEYAWNKNKGYPTPEHKKAIAEYGISPFHRLSFRLAEQLKISF